MSLPRRPGGAVSPPRTPSRPPYWTVPAFLALMMVPGAGLPIALGALALVSLAVGVLRARVARRAQSAGPAVVPAGAVRLGRAVDGRALHLTDDQLAAHGLILGASGAGKTTTLLRILTDRIERGQPVIAVDLKGSPAFAHALAEAAARAGRSCQLWSPDGPSYFNPLAHGNPTELKDKLIATERFTEPHYQRAAERYLQTALKVLAELHPERAPTLAEVVALTEPKRLGIVVRGVSPALRVATQDYLSGLTSDQLSAVRGFGTRLAILTESHVGRYLAAPPAGADPAAIDLHAALRGEAVVVFSLNASSYGNLAAQIGTMVIQDLVAASGTRLAEGGTETAAQGLVALDEFSALGADHLGALFARGREAGVPVVVATQELADLGRAGRGLRELVLGNTAVKIVHRQDVPESARTIAQMAGTEWVADEIRQFGGGGLRALIPQGTRRLVERLRFHPDQIAGLRTGEALVITKLPESNARIIQVEPPAPPAPPPRPPVPARPVPPRSRPISHPQPRAPGLRARFPAPPERDGREL